MLYLCSRVEPGQIDLLLLMTMSQPNCNAVPEFMFFLIWLLRLYLSKVRLSISKLPYLTF